MHMSIMAAVCLPVAFALSGCGGSSDPLAGTWSNTTCYGSDTMPADIESCAVSLRFTDELTIELQADWLSMPATADYPGCTTTKLVTGQSWSTQEAKDYDVLTIAGTGTPTIERTGCVYDADNMDPTDTTEISIPEGDVDYQISGDGLTVMTTSLEGSYTKDSFAGL